MEGNNGNQRKPTTFACCCDCKVIDCHPNSNNHHIRRCTGPPARSHLRIGGQCMYRSCYWQASSCEGHRLPVPVPESKTNTKRPKEMGLFWTCRVLQNIDYVCTNAHVRRVQMPEFKSGSAFGPAWLMFETRKQWW